MPTDIQARLLALTSPFAAELVRLARAEGHAAGLATGLERGRREAQTEIDGLTYERGRDEERARVAALLGPRLRNAVDVAVLDGEELWCVELRAAFTEYEAAIRSGEPAPEAK
jgi:hypothetical protein